MLPESGNTFLPVLLGLTLVLFGASAPIEPRSDASGAELDTQRLLGKAHYENNDYKKAAAAFTRCVELAPDSPADHFNLALVQLRASKLDTALRSLDRAAGLDPTLLGVRYLRGIIRKRQGKYDRAVEHLRYVLQRDPQCFGAWYNLGACNKYLRNPQEALDAFERAIQISPTHPSVHYQLMTLFRQLGNVDRATHHRDQFVKFKDSVSAPQRTAEALERSRYSLVLEAPRLTADLRPQMHEPPRFVEMTTAAGLGAPRLLAVPPAWPVTPIRRSDFNADVLRRRFATLTGSAVTLADYDGDGDTDIYVVNCSGDANASANQLYRNDGNGKFTDVTLAAGVGDMGCGLDAAFADFDNDGDNDLYVVNDGPNVLYRNDGAGVFKDVSEAARANEPLFGRRAIFVDYDHDNDLDLYLANEVDLSIPPETDPFHFPRDLSGQFNTLLRNNGNGTFTDQTDEAGLLVAPARTLDVIAADFDADHDIDLLVVNADAPSRLFLNRRAGAFDPGGTFEPPIGAGGRAAAEGDFNRDGRPDLLLAIQEKLILYTNKGAARFKGSEVVLPEKLAKIGLGRVLVGDFNDDGWPDLLLLGAEGKNLALLAGAGLNRFTDITERAGLNAVAGQIADVAVGDLDGDGDLDLAILTRDRGLRLFRNDRAKPARWLDVRLKGKKVNKSAYGAVVEIAAAGHYQRQTVRSGPVHFGLGDLTGIDVVRVIWPGGIAQNVIRPPLDETLTIEEHVRVSASCGFLFAFDGAQFTLVNELLGIGPLGAPMAPGVYHQPDCTELIKIESHELTVRGGWYDLRLTEDLREIMFADQLTLRVVDHPFGLEVIPNEMFTAPPFPEDRFFAVADHLPPRSAVDHTGVDVLDILSKRDGRHVTFETTPYDGLAEVHSLTLDLGDLPAADQTVLFLDGWIYWPDASTVMAIAQDPRYELAPLSLEVLDKEGRWQIAIESVGLPTSKGLVVPVDLAGRFLTDDRHVRLRTNLCVYFDRIFISTRDDADRCRVTELPVASADLRYRGFASVTRDDLGFERFDYAEVSPTGAWSPPAGMLTRYGDVTPLLQSADNMYVIFGPGDELALRFDARDLPELPEGWVRDFIFYANGWVKDGDLNTAFSQTIAPLPFHGMSAYPPPERYPDTPELKHYRRTYNTRPSRPTIGVLSSQHQ